MTGVQTCALPIYKCANTKKVHICDKKAVRKDWIEDLVVEKAMKILHDDKLVEYLTERIFVLQGEENPRIPHLKGQLADTEKRIENLMNAIEQGIITDTTKDRLAQLESKKKEIEIAILQEKIKKPFLTKEQILFGIERFRNLDMTTLEGKRRLIDGFVNSIYLYDDRFDITFNFKDGTQTVFFSEIEATKNSDIKSLGAPNTGVRLLPYIQSFIKNSASAPIKLKALSGFLLPYKVGFCVLAVFLKPVKNSKVFYGFRHVYKVVGDTLRIGGQRQKLCSHVRRALPAVESGDMAFGHFCRYVVHRLFD